MADITPIPQADPILPNWFPKIGGNTLQFAVNASNPWPYFKKLAEEEAHREIFQAKVGPKTLVFITGRKLVEEVCNQTRFRKQVTAPIEEIQKSVNIALFTAYHDSSKWPVHHDIIAPKLTPEAVKDLCFGDFLNTTNELFDIWRDKAPGAVIEPLVELDRLNLEATTLSLFGKKLNCFKTGHYMLKAMDDATGEAVQRPTRKLPWQKFFNRNKLDIATDEMRTYAQDLIDYRRQNPTDRKDLLAAMLNDTAKEKENPIPRKLRNVSKTDSEVVDEIVSMPIGSSTAPCAISGGMYYLAKHSEIVAAARKELDAVVGDYELTYENVGQLKYIEGIIRESLRLSFAAPGFNIEPIHTKNVDTGNVILNGNDGKKYSIPYNQGMIVVLAGASRDGTVFGEDGKKFMPERMVGERYDALPAGVKKYYGNGTRECVGKHYAWLWQMVVMAKLIKEFDFELADPKYELHHYGWFNERPIGFKVKISPRKGTKKYSL
ncbi:Bifunctional cytochrome P450/NADPH--P450 reductase [Colletotrichum siamense]|nr:Bifunctional cytochrome P450/NADPH--P450 reductase [Colletotrichum siamense]